MTRIVEDVAIKGSDRTGYTVSYYEWIEGEGRDCGLHRESHCGTLDEAYRMVDAIAPGEARAYRWARENQGYAGDFSSWLRLSARERRSYEDGAAGLPTA